MWQIEHLEWSCGAMVVVSSPQLEGSLGGPGAALAQRRDAEPDDHGVLEAATMLEFILHFPLNEFY